MNDPRTNPCLAEQKASYKCLDKNNYDREACQQYFDAYKDCKNKMNLARRQGVPFVKDPPTDHSLQTSHSPNTTPSPNT